MKQCVKYTRDYGFLYLYICAVAGILMFLLTGCGGKTSKEYHHALSFSAESKLIGVWEKVWIKVDLCTDDKQDEPGILEVNENNWEEEMKMRPVKMIFREDHTYRMEHRDLNDSLVQVFEGHWEMTGDSLFMEQTNPEWVSFSYRLDLDHRKASLSTLIDWDGNGIKDIAFYGLVRKVN